MCHLSSSGFHCFWWEINCWSYLWSLVQGQPILAISNCLQFAILNCRQFDCDENFELLNCAIFFKKIGNFPEIISLHILSASFSFSIKVRILLVRRQNVCMLGYVLHFFEAQFIFFILFSSLFFRFDYFNWPIFRFTFFLLPAEVCLWICLVKFYFIYSFS